MRYLQNKTHHMKDNCEEANVTTGITRCIAWENHLKYHKPKNVSLNKVQGNMDRNIPWS